MIKGEGRLQLDDAAGYILQAARGLKYAHELGIIHRDIKPDNLMVNEHGVVKIADMGLAKWHKHKEKSDVLDETKQKKLQDMAYSNLTQANSAMGTPSYMSPEQAKDAASVDSRADEYSLGCTLYYMCAGKAPFSGTTVFELISKHLHEPITPLDVHVHGVPPTFAKIIEKMLEKSPDDRYPSMDGVIKEIESYLGVGTEQGPYTPREQHLAILEEEQKKYYSASSIKKRKISKISFFSLMPLLFISSIWMGNFPLAGGILGLLTLTPLASFALNGIISKDYLFRRVRSVFFRMPIKSWILFIAGSAATIYVLYKIEWLFYWMGFAFVAVGIAAIYQFLVLKKLKTERDAPIKTMHEMLKSLRLRGLAEDALHDFISRFSGIHWEEFFEQLFGYEAMIMARGKWAAADKVKRRKKFAIWREPVARWLEGVEEGRKEAREKKQLAKAEVRKLKAQGVSEKEAKKKAEAEATRILKKGLVKKTKDIHKELERQRGKTRKAPLISVILRFAVSILGLAVCVAALSKVLPDKFNIGVLDPVSGFIPGFYYSWGLGGSLFAAIAGLFLFLMIFSGRTLTRIMVFLGILLLVLQQPLIRIVAQDQFTEQTCFFGGIGLSVLGFGFCVFSKIKGGKF